MEDLMATTVFSRGLEEPEGPVALPDGSLYIVEMSGRTACVTKLSESGERRVVHSTGGRPNGLAIDGDGNIWIVEAGEGALICIDPDGTELTRIVGDGAGPFLWPNDLAFGPDGLLYMTDSGIKPDDFIDGLAIRENFISLPYDGRVYKIDPARRRVVSVIDRGLRFVNGIAFNKDGVLFVNESLGGSVYRYDVFGAAAPRRETFGNVLQPDSRPIFQGPDGMKFGADGRLYCTVYNQKNITVLEQDGSVADRLILIGEKPTNVAFALNGSALYVTEVSLGQVETLKVSCGGLPLHYPKNTLRSP
jgi:gluconolactonase